MIADVTRVFDNYLISTFSNRPNICNFVLKHERKAGCIENLCKQIKGGEAAIGHRPMTSDRYRLMIRETAKMFAQACLQYAEEQALAKAERERRIREAEKIDRAKEIVQELEDEALDDRPISYPGQTTHAR